MLLAGLIHRYYGEILQTKKNSLSALLPGILQRRYVHVASLLCIVTKSYVILKWDYVILQSAYVTFG